MPGALQHRCVQQAQKKRPKAKTGDRPHQPAQVVARPTSQRRGCRRPGLVIAQADHQANRQVRPTDVANAATCHRQCGAEHAVAFEDLAFTFPALELGRYGRLDLISGQSPGQHHRRIVQIDQPIDASVGNFGASNLNFPRNQLKPNWN